MMLCLDVGNSHIYGGVFADDKLLLQFRYPCVAQCTSDQLGVFFKSILRENAMDPAQITQVAVSSVVPSLDYPLRSSLVKYFSIEPFFLKADVNTGLKINYKNSHELGADRISDAIGGMQLYPDTNLIIIDLGTATTFDIIAKDGTYLGGVIIPGIQLAMKALNENTAKLPPVNILKPEAVIGLTTEANIQSGLYYGHLGAMREILRLVWAEQFQGEKAMVLGTGGFAYLFEAEEVFDKIVPDLVLQGLRVAVGKNSN